MKLSSHMAFLIILSSLALNPFQHGVTPIYLEEEVRHSFPKKVFHTEGSSSPSNRERGGITHYQMHVVLDTLKTHSLSCNYSIDYINTENVPLTEIFFHVYPNAWEDEGGVLQINSVTDTEGTPFATERIESTNLRVGLETPLQPESSLEIRMEFEVRIPNIPNRFGYWQSDGMISHNLGNWYPIVSVFDEVGWHTAPYAYWGESFYSEIADYHVNITVPTSEVVAATGNLVDTISGPEGTTIWVWKAQSVRDFVFSVSPDFHLATKPIHGTTIYSYYAVDDMERGERALEIAEKCLTLFPQLYGPYPYATLSIVENPDGIGGMEYPTLVLMGSGLYRLASNRTFEAILVHEIAHQWFPFLIGDNAFAEPFLDEAFATFSEQLYWEFIYGPEAREEARFSTQYHYYSFLNQTGMDEPINQTMAFWDKNEAYFSIVYSKGALVLGMLRFVVGNNTFFRAMQAYYEQFLHKNAKILDFIAIFEEVSELDLEWFFTEWVFQRGLPEYELEHAAAKQIKEGYELTIQVHQKTQYGGNHIFRMPIPFRIQYDHHTETRTMWVNTTNQEIQFNVKNKPFSVELDLQKVILRANINQRLLKPVQEAGRIQEILLSPPTALIVVTLLGLGGLVLLNKWRGTRPKSEKK